MVVIYNDNNQTVVLIEWSTFTADVIIGDFDQKLYFTRFWQC